jgi:hypothetical protein
MPCSPGSGRYQRGNLISPLLIGLSAEELEACRDRGRSAVQGDATFARGLNIVSTPTFLIGQFDGHETVTVAAVIVGAKPF